MPTDASAGDRLGSPSGSMPPEGADDELVFAAHDLGRDALVQQRPAAPPSPPAPVVPSRPDGFVIRNVVGDGGMAPVDALVVGGPAPAAAPEQAPPLPQNGGFRVISSTPRAPRRDDELPWTVRDLSPPPPPSRRGWMPRDSGIIERSAHDTVRRLREDAVQVSWKAAWIAVTSADRRLFKRRSW